MIVVCNSSPIIAFMCLDKIDLLFSLFDLKLKVAALILVFFRVQP